MAIDKLVDSSQLDNNLTLVANAIRAKGGTSANLSFPTDFVTAINAISGGGSTSWETIYSGTVDVVNAESGHYYGWINPWSEPIELNSVWRITWNGIPYECTATWEGSSDGNPYAIGNYTFDGGQGGNNEPFMLQPYYGTQLIVLAETSDSYAITIQKQVSGSSGYTRTIVAPQQTVTSAYRTDGNIDGYFTEITITEPLEEWSDYIITLDDEEYYATGILMWGANISLGIESYFWNGTSGPSYSIPFGILYESGNTCTMAVNSARTMSVKIEKIELTGSGGGDSTTKEIVIPEQTITASTTYNPITNYAEELVIGEQYICTVDGVEYGPYYGVDLYGSVAIGDSINGWLFEYDRGMYFSTEDTSLYGSHTVKVEKVVESGGGSSVTLITKTITQNGTYSAEDDSADGYSEVIVNVNPPVTWETLYEGNATIVSSSPNYISINNFTDVIGEGETWRITWNGVSYTCEGVYNSQITGCYIGNAYLVDSGSSDTGEPFWAYKRTSSQLAFSTNQSAGTITLVVERQTASSATLITKTITQNGTYDAEDDSTDGYSSVTVSVTPNLQSKSATPTTSSQTISPDSGYDGLSSVTVGAIPSQYIVPTGNKSITENGNNIDVAEYATVSVSVSGSSKNVQTAQSTTRATSSTYTNLISLTCSTAGKYDIYWDCFRSTTSGTTGSQLYINGTGQGTANTAFTNHVQTNHLTNITLAEDDVVAVYARSRGSNYYAYVGTLTIIQTA